MTAACNSSFGMVWNFFGDVQAFPATLPTFRPKSSSKDSWRRRKAGKQHNNCQKRLGGVGYVCAPAHRSWKVASVDQTIESRRHRVHRGWHRSSWPLDVIPCYRAHRGQRWHHSPGQREDHQRKNYTTTSSQMDRAEARTRWRRRCWPLQSSQGRRYFG